MNEGGGKINRNLIQIIALIAMAMFIGVKDIAAPLISEMSGRAAAEAKIASDNKIYQLETIIGKLGVVSETVAAQSEAIRGLRDGVERLERKLDSHIGK